MNTGHALRLILLAAIWGASFLFLRISAPVLGAMQTAFWRIASGTIALCLVVFVVQSSKFRGTRKGLARDRVLLAMLVGVVSTAIPFYCYSFAARLLPTGYSAILNATTPLMGILVGALAFRERVTLVRAMGVVLGIFGVAVLARVGPVPLDAAVLSGVGACLVATLCYAIGGFLTQRWIVQRGGMDSRLLTTLSLIGASIAMLPLGAADLLRNPHVLDAAGPGIWASVIVLGVVCTAIAYLLYYRLILDIGALRAMSVTMLIPVFGLIWGWVFLDEQITVAHVIGGGLITLALVLVMRSGSAKVARR